MAKQESFHEKATQKPKRDAGFARTGAFFADYDEPGGRIVITRCGEHLDAYVTPSL